MTEELAFVRFAIEFTFIGGDDRQTLGIGTLLRWHADGIFVAVGVEIDGGEKVGEEGFEFYVFAKDFDAFCSVVEVLVPKYCQLYIFFREYSTRQRGLRQRRGRTLGD